MSHYTKDASRRGEFVTIYCEDCNCEVEGMICYEEYLVGDGFLEEIGQTVKDALDASTTYIVIEDENGEEHRGT